MLNVDRGWSGLIAIEMQKIQASVLVCEWEMKHYANRRESFAFDLHFVTLNQDLNKTQMPLCDIES